MGRSDPAGAAGGVEGPSRAFLRGMPRPRRTGGAAAGDRRGPSRIAATAAALAGRRPVPGPGRRGSLRRARPGGLPRPPPHPGREPSGGGGGRTPVAISWRRTPRLQRSVRRSATCPVRSSGLAYPREPRGAAAPPRRRRSRSPRGEGRPPGEEDVRGLHVAVDDPRPCAASSAAATPRPMRGPRRGGGGGVPGGAGRPASPPRGRPWPGRPGVVGFAHLVDHPTWGWSRRATRRASARSSALAAGLPTAWGGRSLSATSRSSSGSRAR
jgi:translation initiation factor IF-2